MISKLTKKNKKEKVYKSLYDVKDTYLPNASLPFLEGIDDEHSRDAFMKMIKKNQGTPRKRVLEQKS